MEGKLLTQKEINDLQEGTSVVVIWSGGNGPHIYQTIKRDGWTCVNNIYKDSLDYCGKKPKTQVRLAKEA